MRSQPALRCLLLCLMLASSQSAPCCPPSPCTLPVPQVLVGLEWGCRDLFAHVSSVYGIRAWFKQVR